MQPHKNRNNRLFWVLISSAIAVAVGSGIYTTWEWTKPCLVRSDKRIWGRCYRDLQAKPLTIGIAIGSPDEDYNALATYLRNQLNSQVEIELDTPYEKLSDRIARKDWDIAFTRSPIFSIVAEDNHYTGIAVMFPEQPPYYRAALYVRADSPIQAIAQIKPTTTLALGNPESVDLFCKEQTQNFTIIEGQVEEYNVPTEGTIEFKVVTQDKQVYVVLVSREILNQIPINPVGIVDKFVQIKSVKPRKLTDGTWKVTITKPNQLSIIQDLTLD